MTPVEPLNAQEERLWRALMRVLIVLPRSLDRDLVHATGLSLSEYSVLLNLSEAENGELRMVDLAAAASLSASRITRVVETLQSRGHVVKRRHEKDGRGNVTALTPAGLARLREAYPAHLASVRRRVVDRLDKESLASLVRQLEGVADDLD